MSYGIQYTEIAREDVREIVLWYRNEQDGLEKRFLLSLEAAISSLSKNPLINEVNFGVISLLPN